MKAECLEVEQIVAQSAFKGDVYNVLRKSIILFCSSLQPPYISLKALSMLHCKTIPLLRNIRWKPTEIEVHILRNPLFKVQRSPVSYSYKMPPKPVWYAQDSTAPSALYWPHFIFGLFVFSFIDKKKIPVNYTVFFRLESRAISLLSNRS